MFSHKEAYEERSDEYLAEKKRKKQLAAAAAASSKDPESGLKSSLLMNADATANRDSDELVRAAGLVNASSPTPGAGAGTTTATSETNNESDDDDDDDDDEDVLGFRPALLWLAVVTVFIAILSELISDSIEDGAKAMGKFIFLSTVLVDNKS